ncbi:MAG: lipid-binding SYLF domain-containing protein [Pirellulales bacterium]
MDRSIWLCIVLATAFALATPAQAQAEPDLTVREANEVMHQIMAIPGNQIPTALLDDAQGIAIIPNVLKIGFIAGIRRGHGVVMVREPNGAWSLPQFMTLTGGSVGWQAGVQDTDVVLVFMTKKSIEGLLGGKFTIGADAAAAAGPVGRNASAATDARLQAEVLSYSRSRGLFAGVALDGTVLRVDPIAQTTYYGSGPGQPPAQVPESAAALVVDVTAMTSAGNVPIVADGPTLAQPGAVGIPTLAASAAAGVSVRESLAGSAAQLQSIVDDGWRQYLALPPQVFDAAQPPNIDGVRRSLQQYDRVARDPRYAALTNRPEFQATYRLLSEYVQQLAAGAAQVQLPPPPMQ